MSTAASEFLTEVLSSFAMAAAAVAAHQEQLPQAQEQPADLRRQGQRS